MTDQEIRAAQLGISHAFQVCLRAICATHPNPDALIAALASEHQESMSLLLAKPPPDVAIEAYKDTLRGCVINPNKWLES